MKAIVIVIASLTLTGAAAAATTQAAGWPGEPIHGEMSSFERGFRGMLTRSSDAPVKLTPRNELDAVDLLVAKALAADARCVLRPDSGRKRR